MPIDPNEAPEGYYAVQDTYECAGCVFLTSRSKCEAPVGAKCQPSGRADKSSVIFVVHPGKSDDLTAQLKAMTTERDRLRGVLAQLQSVITRNL